ncbi:MAG: energy transducer TonB [Pseudomonadota bacterium]
MHANPIRIVAISLLAVAISACASTQFDPQRQCSTPPVSLPHGADKPTLAYGAVPAMPAEAMKNQTPGLVDLLIDICADGSVANVRVVGGMNVALYERAAVNAMLESRFNPVQLNGEPVAVRDIERDYTFEFEF